MCIYSIIITVNDMNYPNGIRKQAKNKAFILDNHANRGMSLEDEINKTNEYYRESNIAIIYKKPTPIKITKVDYPSRKGATIKEAYFMTPSTTDYNGIYKGKYIDFEAKETKQTTSFPLNNIHKHQIKHLNDICTHGGIGFLIIRFTNLNKTYLLTEKALNDFIQKENKKSIPLSYFEKHGHLIKDKFIPRVDYIEIINELYIEGGKTWKKN